MKTLLWLDDVRNPFLNKGGKVPKIKVKIIWVRTYEEFKRYIETYGLLSYISFDHDLGMGKTGYDCAKWLVDFCMDNKKKIT